MAECHPVGFQWVMEAKERGAKVIHVDPRFTRTSALADLHVPLRAGSDIAFLGGIVNHILTNEREFRPYVEAYTNASVIITDEFRDTEDLGGLFSGWDPDSGSYDIETWQYEGMEVLRLRRQARRGRGLRRERPRRAGRQAQTWRPARDRSDARGSALRLSDPQAALQPIHAGEGRRDLRRAGGDLPRGRRGALRELRPRAHLRLRLRGRLDPAHGRRPVHPDRGDHPAAARQHGPSRRRDHGAARSRLDPGLDRHPDALQHPPRLHPDAAPARARDPRGLPRDELGRDRLLGPHGRLHDQPAEGLVRRMPRPPTTTTASTTCRG